MFSLKKYLKNVFLILVVYVFTIVAGAMVGSINGAEEVACAIFAAVGGIIYIPMLFYYLYLFFKTRTKLKTAEIKEGAVSSWNLIYMSKTMAYVVINDGLMDYNTAAIFSRYSAPEMVGCRVLYAIIDDKAVIIETMQ